MQPDPTREELLHTATTHSWTGCGDGVIRMDALQWDRIQLVLADYRAEPARAAAMRAEGYREGVEEAARWHEGRETHIRKFHRDEEMRRMVAMHRDFARMLRALIPSAPPAPEPAWTPTHRHYKGGLYREIERVPDRSDDEARPAGIVVYEGEDRKRHSIDARRWDGDVADVVPGRMWEVENQRRRYAPITPEPTHAA